MKHHATFEQMRALDRRLGLLMEGRRAERIMNLWWLAQQHKAVCRFLKNLTLELRAQRKQLAEDHGLDGEEMEDIQRSRSAAKRAAVLSPALRAAGR